MKSSMLVTGTSLLWLVKGSSEFGTDEVPSGVGMFLFSRQPFSSKPVLQESALEGPSQLDDIIRQESRSTAVGMETSMKI